MQTEVQSGSPGQHPITRVDAPGKGGAAHAYVIHGLALVSQNPSYGLLPLHHQPQRRGIGLLFQQGPPEGDEDNPRSNGIHSEDLLAILIDRHEGFAKGPFNCPENDLVVHHLREALALLDARRARRKESGVLGQQVPDPRPLSEVPTPVVDDWQVGDFVQYEGSEYEIAEKPSEGFVGIYDERPDNDHIEFVKVSSVTFSRAGNPDSEETSDSSSEGSSTGAPPVSDTSPDSSSEGTDPADTGSGSFLGRLPDVEDMTAKELYDEAVSRNIPGRSAMSKEELQTAVAEARKA